MASRTEAAVAMVQRRVPANEIPRPLLTITRLYRSGELADLVVQSETRAFRAHRDIVFKLLPFLQESCIATPEDRLPFFVRIPASERVVDTIHRHMYQINVVLPFENLDNGSSVAEAGSLALRCANKDNFIFALEGLLTCTKYGIDELSDRFERAVVACMFFAQDADDLIFMAEIASDYPLKMVSKELWMDWGLQINDKLCYMALINLAFEVDRVLEEPRGWLDLDHAHLRETVARCREICARYGLQRGASGSCVYSKEMRHFLIIDCGDMFGYDVTQEEVKEILMLETMRRGFEAAHRHQRQVA